MAQRKVTYRLYPNAEQQKALAHTRWTHCLLWNQALHERRYAWGEEQRSLGFSDQCKILTEWRAQSSLLRGINAQSQQVTLKRLDLAFGLDRDEPLAALEGCRDVSHLSL